MLNHVPLWEAMSLPPIFPIPTKANPTLYGYSHEFGAPAPAHLRASTLKRIEERDKKIEDIFRTIKSGKYTRAEVRELLNYGETTVIKGIAKLIREGRVEEYHIPGDILHNKRVNRLRVKAPNV